MCGRRLGRPSRLVLVLALVSAPPPRRRHVPGPCSAPLLGDPLTTGAYDAAPPPPWDHAVVMHRRRAPTEQGTTEPSRRRTPPTIPHAPVREAHDWCRPPGPGGIRDPQP